MESKLIRVLEVTEFNFTDLTDDNSRVSFYIKRKIESIGFTEGMLIVRVHDGTVFSQADGEYFNIKVFTDGATEQDPGTLFRDFLTFNEGFLLIYSVTDVPSLITRTFSGFGSMVSIMITGKPSARAASILA